MSDIDFVRLDPPQRRKKWVEFQENDIESQIFSEVRRHSTSGMIPINNKKKFNEIKTDISFESSLSSPLSSSLGSTGEEPTFHTIKKTSNLLPNKIQPQQQQPSCSPPTSQMSFNASFGGFSHTGAPASLKEAFPTSGRMYPNNRRTPRLPSVSSNESVGSSTTTTSIRFSDVNEIEDLEERCSEVILGEEMCKYSALENIKKQDGVYTGWSNLVLGESMGWSENIKSDKAPSQQGLKMQRNPTNPSDKLSVESCSQLTIQDYAPVLLETESSPDLSSLRQITWPRSPSRSFVRNFP